MDTPVNPSTSNGRPKRCVVNTNCGNTSRYGETDCVVSTNDPNYADRVRLMISEESAESDVSDEEMEFDDSDADPNYVLPNEARSNSNEEDDSSESDEDLDRELDNHSDEYHQGRLPPYVFGRLRKNEAGPPYYWTTKEPSRNVRTPARNIIRGGLPGLTVHARTLGNEPSPLDVWNSLFDRNVVDLIVNYTNQKLATVRGSLRPTTELSNYRDTNAMEMNAYIGLLLLSSITKSNNEKMESLFTKDVTNRPIFVATLSLVRYKILTSCLRFDDANTREARKATDKSAAIAQLFAMLLSNFQRSYTPSEYVTIDEMLIPFRGRCSFKVYMPKKPKKYGVKVMCLCDSKTSYMYNAYIYTGAGSDGRGLTESQQNFLMKPTQCVVRLCKPIEHTNRNVTADNYFSSIETVDELNKRELTYVGTMKKDKLIIPKEFLPDKQRIAGSSDHAFNGNTTLVSFVPKKNRAVVLISTMHHTADINERNRKPEIVCFYNETKCGVDLLDMKCAIYNSNRKTRRWPLAVFYRMLGVCSVNAYILFLSFRNNPMLKRFEFVKQLSLSLITPQLQNRLTIPTLPRDLKETIKKILPQDNAEGPNAEVDAIPNDKLPKRKTCGSCPYEKKRKTAYQCIKCKKPVCLECTRKVCLTCAKTCV